jgi:hypothetical protein
MNCSKDLTRLLAMLVSDDDLRKLDDAHLKELSHDQLLELSMQVVRDLEIARDRLNQNPENSSRPPSGRVPWAGLGLTDWEGARPEGLEAGREEAADGSKAIRTKHARAGGK